LAIFLDILRKLTLLAEHTSYSCEGLAAARVAANVWSLKIDQTDLWGCDENATDQIILPETHYTIDQIDLLSCESNDYMDYVDYCLIDDDFRRMGSEDTVIGCCGLVNAGHNDPDFISEDFSAEIQALEVSESRLKPLIVSGESRPFVLISCLTHLALLCLLIFFPPGKSAGAGGNSHNAVMIRLLESEEIIPQEESPASRDSAAALPSIANRKAESPELRDKMKGQRPVPLLDLNDQAIREQTAADCDEHNLEVLRTYRVYATIDKEFGKIEDAALKDPEKESAKKDDVTVRTPNKHDSMASTPSTASPERRSMTSAGREGDEFRAQIISAIHAAAYYPKKALNERLHGEAVVAFTVSRNGSISNLALKKHSGSLILDEAAIKIVQKASEKFPCIPERLTTDSFSYEVPIIFKNKI